MNKPISIPTSANKRAIVKRHPATFSGFFTIAPQKRPEGTRYKILCTIPELGMYKHLVSCTSRNQLLDGRYTFRAYYYATGETTAHSTPSGAIDWCLDQTCKILCLELITKHGRYATSFGGIIQYFNFAELI